MKKQEYAEARRMRIEEGESIIVIAKKLAVSKGIVSKWCSDIKLTEAQERVLAMRNPSLRGQFNGALANKNNGLALREEYQKQGRELAMAYKNDCEFCIGCALYWGEGGKQRTSASITNMDANMLFIIKKWLVKYFGCQNDNFSVFVNAYLSNGLSVDEINSYWINTLELKKESIKKITAREMYYSGKNRAKNYSFYGVCQLRYHSVEIMQKIHGAIQEIMNVNKPEWVS